MRAKTLPIHYTRNVWKLLGSQGHKTIATHLFLLLVLVVIFTKPKSHHLFFSFSDFVADSLEAGPWPGPKDLARKQEKEHALLMFRENQVCEEDIACKGILSRTWVELVAKKSPTSHPNRTQNGARMASKTIQK